MTDKKKNSATPLNSILHELFQFDEEDVRLNRQHIISDAQKQRMTAKHNDDMALAWLGFRLFAVIGLVGSTAAALQAGDSLMSMWRAAGISLAVIGGVTAVILAYSKIRLQRTLNGATVMQVRGDIVLTSQNYGKIPTYYLSVGSKNFPLSDSSHAPIDFAMRQRLDQWVRHGERLSDATVYYAHPWQYVLSVEQHPPQA